jgi:Protein of unknown function (DUF3592)
MEILEQRPERLVCHQSANLARGMGIFFAAMGAGALVLFSHVSGQAVHGSLWVAPVAGIAFVLTGVLTFLKAEDDRIVLDRTASIARIIRRGLWRQSTMEVPFKIIRDVALEVSASQYASNQTRQLNWRAVFVCDNDRRVPWTPLWTSDRATQARAVAAARTMGGWTALPIEGAPAVAQAVSSVRNLGCLYVFAALFIGFLLFLTAIQVMPLLTWKPTSATVVSSNVGWVRSSKGGTTWKPVIEYTYTVDGATYSSYRIAPVEESASKNWALGISQRYQPGAVVPAWYNPRHPADAYIEHTLSMIPLIMIAVFAGTMLAIVALAKRSMVATRAAFAGGDVPVVPARL